MARRVKIRRVVDGDSVEAQYGGLLGMMRRRPFPVRLYAIDAPELAQPNGAAARAHLQSLVRGGGSLRIEVMDTDRYGRRVALLYRGRGRRGRRNSVNAQMVQAGMAYWYGRYGGQELGLDRAEAEARRQRRGVWRRGGKGQRPWDYRSDRRNREGRRGGTLAVAAAVDCGGGSDGYLAGGHCLRRRGGGNWAADWRRAGGVAGVGRGRQTGGREGSQTPGARGWCWYVGMGMGNQAGLFGKRDFVAVGSVSFQVVWPAVHLSGTGRRP